MRDRLTSLDSYDVKILAALQREGRMKKVELAAEIGLTPSPCWERLRRLEKEGFIRGYRAEVDLDKVIKTERVFVTVTLGSHEAVDFSRFEKTIRGTPEVLDCYALGGGVDYLLHIVVPDVARYQALMERLLRADVGIHQYVTYVVTKHIKQSRGFPIPHLLAKSRSGQSAN